MRFRNTLILAVLLALGVWSVVYLNKRDVQKEETKKSSEKIIAVPTSQIKEIWLQPGDIHAVRDSAEWRIVAPISSPGDKSTLDAIVNMFDWAKMERIISSDPAEYAEFGLQPSRAELILRHTEGVDTLFVGDTNPTGSFVFARKAGSKEVFLTTTSLESNTKKSLFDLRDKSVLSFDRGEVRELVLSNDREQMMFAKEGNGWKMTRPLQWMADEDKVNDILSKVSNQKVVSFEEENPTEMGAFGLNTPSMMLTVLLGENRAQKTLWIGKQVQGHYYGKDLSRSPVFKVDTSFVRGLRVSSKEMRSKKIARFNTFDINKVIVHQNDSTFVFQKDTTNTWGMITPPDKKIKTWKITNLVSELESLKAESFAADAPSSLEPYGLNRPHWICELYQDTQLIKKILLGKQKDEELIFIKTEDIPTVYTVKNEVRDKLKLNFSELIETAVEPTTNSTESTSH